MQKLFTLLAAIGLATSLCGITHNNSAASAQAGRRLSTAEMYGTRGNGYACQTPICNRPDNEPYGCNPYMLQGYFWESFYDPGFGITGVSGGSPTPPSTTMEWCQTSRFYTDSACQTFYANGNPSYAYFCAGGGL